VCQFTKVFKNTRRQVSEFVGLKFSSLNIEKYSNREILQCFELFQTLKGIHCDGGQLIVRNISGIIIRKSKRRRRVIQVLQMLERIENIAWDHCQIVMIQSTEKIIQ
jgi:hypothetical protein